MSFYNTREWLELRYKVLSKYGSRCMLCGDNESVAHVDHIKPISKHPELKLDFDNLQILCRACNIGKSNKDSTDFRQKRLLEQTSLQTENDYKYKNGYVFKKDKPAHIWNKGKAYCGLGKGYSLGSSYSFTQNSEGLIFCKTCQKEFRKSKSKVIRKVRAQIFKC